MPTEICLHYITHHNYNLRVKKVAQFIPSGAKNWNWKTGTEENHLTLTDLSPYTV